MSINITITVNNIKSILELGYFTFWLSRITYNSKTAKENKEPVKKHIIIIIIINSRK